MAASTFQSDDSGVVKAPSSPNDSQSVSTSPPWSSIVAGNFSSDSIVSGEGQIGNFTSDSSPSSVPEIEASVDNCGTEGQGSESGGGGSNVSKKPVWNKPSNGVVEVVSPVMGAVSWPALGEVSKSSPKSSSSESLKGLADGPLLPASQVVTENSSSSSPKHAKVNNVHPTSTQNHVAPTKQRSMKRGSGGFNLNVSANGGVSYNSPRSQDSLTENPHNASGKPGSAPVESSPRDNQRSGSQSHNGTDQQPQRNTYRRSNSGPHSRGDGSYHHSYGGKRDQDREWKQHSKSFNGRDNHTHSQRGYPRGYIRPSVHAPPPTFIPPQMPILRPFGNNLMYPDMPSTMLYIPGAPPPPESLRGMPPLVGPISPPMYFVTDPMLPARIVSQIDYYFSNDNLVKDTYLRKNMDEQGWVPVSLIAGFKKVLLLTDNIQLILDSMRASTIVEVQGDKIRRRNDWMRWLMQPPAQAVGNEEVLASQLQGVKLDDATLAMQDSVPTSVGSGGPSNQLQQGTADVDSARLII